MPLTPWLSHYKTDFELARRRRQESIAFDALRCEAFDRFLLRGFPTADDDAWRFPDIRPVAETNFTLGAKPAAGARCREVTTLPLRDLAEIELVFVNGYFMPDVSTAAPLPNGAIAAPLAPLVDSNADELGGYFARVARVEPFAFVALNTALFEDGAAVIVPARTTIEQPIHARLFPISAHAVQSGEHAVRLTCQDPAVRHAAHAVRPCVIDECMEVNAALAVRHIQAVQRTAGALGAKVRHELVATERPAKDD